MLGVTFFGIFLTPVFYVVIRWLGMKMGMRPPHHLPPPPDDPDMHAHEQRASIAKTAAVHDGNGNGNGQDHVAVH